MIVNSKFVIVFSLFQLLIGQCEPAFAQPSDPGSDPDVPIAGIEWLLVCGGLFGMSKMFRRLKKH